jgi:hypothetical protein
MSPGERHKLCQLLEQLEAEKADEPSKLQLAIAARDAAQRCSSSEDISYGTLYHVFA